MSQPQPYAPLTTFVTVQLQQPWFPGSQLDVEFNNIRATLGQTLANLQLLQRDDGAIQNGSVHLLALDAALQSTLTGVAVPNSSDLAWKSPVRVATTANIILGGLQAIDGVTVAANDRVLVKNQADQTTNGIYLVSAGPWTRTLDAANNSQWVQGVQVSVAQGTANANSIYRLTTANPIILGTSTLVFAAQLTSSRNVNTTAPLAGGGALSSDLTLSLAINSTLAVVANALQIATGGVAYANIQNVAASRLLGNPTGGAAAPAEISLGATLAFAGSALQTAAGTGDVTWSANAYATTIAAGAVTVSKIATGAIATTAQFLNNTASEILTTDKVWGAGAEVSVASGATVTFDLSTGINFTCTMGTNVTFSFANAKAGQAGYVRLLQDATGSRTASWTGSTPSIFWTGGGTAPTLQTAANKQDFIFYVVLNTGAIVLTYVLGF